MDNLPQKIFNFALDILFPKFCLGCRKEGTYLCEDCRSILDINEFAYCLCDRPRRLPDPTAGKCTLCQNKKLSGLYFALPYKEHALTKKLIHQFKYRPYLKDLSATLASILAEHFVRSGRNTDEIWGNAVLIPVPIDKNKLKIRGYNQSEELAKELAKIIKIPVISETLVKMKPTRPQMELSKKERSINLENAFKIKNPAGPAGKPLGNIQGKKIFLVDDVYTTGSTMQECAKTLKQSGAKEVWGICIARET